MGCFFSTEAQFLGCKDVFFDEGRCFLCCCHVLGAIERPRVFSADDIFVDKSQPGLCSADESARVVSAAECWMPCDEMLLCTT